MTYTQPCGMWITPFNPELCGKPATRGWLGETGGITPICEDCRSSITPRPVVTRLQEPKE